VVSLPIGYAVSLEQFEPAVAVELAAAAEQAGFAGTISGDQFQPPIPQGDRLASFGPCSARWGRARAARWAE
jgi:alkanesulfonate monooxygenase SsuD/methylene tetrahydromethanopterin reductase-like flavin-dependent oxidoreductase (luciferase family)